MSWKTPRVEAGELHEPHTTSTILVGSPRWFDWLDDEQHRCFHYVHLNGDFTARKERKQRGQWYWVAYKQAHRRLFKTYLGKTETLTESRLCAAAEHLAHTEAQSLAPPAQHTEE